MISWLKRLLGTERSFTIRDQVVFLNGRPATPEQTAEALALMDCAIDKLDEATGKLSDAMLELAKAARKDPK